MVFMPVQLVFISFQKFQRRKISYTQSPQEEFCYGLPQEKEFTQAQIVLFPFYILNYLKNKAEFKEKKKQVINSREEKNPNRDPQKEKPAIDEDRLIYCESVSQN